SRPELRLAVPPGSVVSPRFIRQNGCLAAAAWKRIKQQAALYGLTPSVVLLTAFSEVIATWSKSRRFSINLTLSNRLPLHPQVNEVIGDFTSFIPLAIEHSASDSVELCAGTVQEQLCEDIKYRSFNGVEIVRELIRAQGLESNFCFPVVFTSLLGQSQPQGERGNRFWMGKVQYGISQTPQVWLDHQVIEQDGDLVFHWDAVE